ncbi:MAG: putative DNA-binding domain-containing protein [Rubrivivax sp.]|nr:putative DNA-binding domain-containing protein [Rubrivivax sp.]
MSALLALQTALQQHVLDAAEGIRAAIAPGPGIAVDRRLQIYHHAYRARLVETLADTFGHTASYLGGDWFEADARAFIETHPSTRASLRWYGADFAAWLQQRHPQDGDIGELAALDWALRRAFDGPDAPVPTLAHLATLPPEAWATLGFALQPTAERLTLHFNTLAIWQALDGDSTPPTAAPLAAPGALLVWRRDLQPHFRTLGPVEALALTHLAAGDSFAATCATLAEAFVAEDTAAQAGALLRRWIDEGLLASVTGWPAA